MEFKGTKGEWFFKEFNNPKLRNRFHIFSGNGTNVCKIVRDDNDNCEEEKSNAKLIVCAPKMLEMLKDVLDCNNRGFYEHINFNEIEQLIKKSTE